MTENPFEAMRLLTQRIEEIAIKLNLEIISINFIPEEGARNGNNDVINIFFSIESNAIKTEAEREVDSTRSAFDDIMGSLELGPEDDEGIPTIIEKDDVETETNPLLKELKKRSDDARKKTKKEIEEWLNEQDK